MKKPYEPPTVYTELFAQEMLKAQTCTCTKAGFQITNTLLSTYGQKCTCGTCTGINSPGYRS